MSIKDLGTTVHGICSTEDLDTSGERIQIKNIDISSLTAGVLNFEHKSENSLQVVGRIIAAKKILKESDCENDAHKYFWKKARKQPYLYIAAILFDKFDHDSAKAAASMFEFDNKIDKEKMAQVCFFSIEGNRLGKEGSTITACIARDVALTKRPCNRACIAELLENPDDYIKSITKEKIESSVKKAEQEYITMAKSDPSNFYNSARAKKPKETPKMAYSKITPTTGENKPGTPIVPKRTFTQQNAPKDMKVGDRIMHNKPKAKAGATFYRDLYKDLENPVRKAVMKKNEELNTEPSKKEIMKHLGNEAWENFKGKDLLIDIIEKKDPELTKNEVLGIAKTIAYIDMKKKESELEDLFEKDESVEKSTTISKDEYQAQKRQKGVHIAGPTKHSVIDRQKPYSVSDAGTAVRNKMPNRAKKEHKKVLQEQKQMKRPNLPKSETDMVKAKYDEGLSDNSKRNLRSRRDVGANTGVHETRAAYGNAGQSKAGAHVASAHRAKQYGTKSNDTGAVQNYHKQSAKQKHHKVLQEQKRMPKPNLPKSEQDVVKNEEK